MQCPIEDQWLSFLDGALPAEEQRVLDAHLDECSACRKLTAAIVRTRVDDEVTPQSQPSFHASRGDLKGVVLGRYVLLERLGEGGMGIVYAAYDPTLDRRIAVKLIKHGLHADDAGHHERLLTEARALAKVSHPNVITVHDVGELDGQIFIAMELIDGPTLRAFAKNRQWQEVWPKLLDAAAGLEAAHRAGIVHGDFKPDNVIVSSQGQALVTDFGLAQTVEVGTHTSSTVGGTPSFMAPEQVASKQSSPQSDQFAFCLTARQLLFRAEAPPAAIERVLRRGLSVDPSQRFESMQALIEALQAAPRRRRRFTTAAMALSALALASAAYLAWSQAANARCAVATSGLDTSWGTQRQNDIHRAFNASGLELAEDSWERVRGRLDAYATDWAAMRGAACLDEPWLRASTLHQLARSACLTRAAAKFDSLTEVLLTADAETIRRAARVTEKLEPLASCAAASTLDAPAELDETVRTLHRLEAQIASGQTATAVEGLRTLTTAIGPEHPLAPDAWAAYVAALTKTQAFGEVDSVVMTALASAHRAARDDLVATVSALFAQTLADRGTRLAEARQWATLAQSSLERRGQPLPSMRAEIERVLGLIALRQGNASEAELHWAKAATETETAFGLNDARVANALNNLGGALMAQQKLDEAWATYQRIFAMAESPQGTDVTVLVSAMSNGGSTLMALGRPVDALALSERSVSMARKAYGSSLTLARLLLNASTAALAVGGKDKLLQARDWAREGAAMEAAILGAAPEALFAQSLLGSAELMVGEPRRALAVCSEALEHMHALTPPPDPGQMANAVGCVGQAQMQLGRSVDGVAALEQANTLLAGPTALRPQLAQMQFALAIGLREVGGAPQRSVALARTAHDTFSSMGLAQQAKEIEAWLAESARRGQFAVQSPR